MRRVELLIFTPATKVEVSHVGELSFGSGDDRAGSDYAEFDISPGQSVALVLYEGLGEQAVHTALRVGLVAAEVGLEVPVQRMDKLRSGLEKVLRPLRDGLQIHDALSFPEFLTGLRELGEAIR